MLINHIIKKRKKFCIAIQSYFRMFMIKKHFSQIFKDTKFIFFYDFNNHLFHQYKTNKDISKQLKIKIFLSKGEQFITTFSYSKYLNLFYIKLKPKIGVIKKKFKVNFYLNDTCIIDPRYHVEASSTGEYYNIITHQSIYRHKKNKIFNNKKTEKIRRSNSQDSSLSSASNIMEQIFETNIKVEKKYSEEITCRAKNIEMKSILKNRSKIIKPDKNSDIRRVSFNHKVEFSY